MAEWIGAIASIIGGLVAVVALKLGYNANVLAKQANEQALEANKEARDAIIERDKWEREQKLADTKSQMERNDWEKTQEEKRENWETERHQIEVSGYLTAAWAFRPSEDRKIWGLFLNCKRTVHDVTIELTRDGDPLVFKRQLIIEGEHFVETVWNKPYTKGVWGDVEPFVEKSEIRIVDNSRERYRILSRSYSLNPGAQQYKF